MGPIASFSGLASGIQWRDLIEQIVRAETAQRLTPVQRESSFQQKRIDAWSSYGGLVTKMNSAAQKLEDGTAFGAFQVSGGVSPTTSRTLLTATASESATPGSYNVEVLSLARAESMASASRTSDTDALGLSGTFALNGKTITVGTADGLAAIRDKINAAGAGVTAGVLRAANGDFRLTLTSDTMGSTGIAYADGPEGVGVALGLATTVAGSDAKVALNGVTVTRQSNTISDALTGVTLNLQQAEAGTVVDLSITRDQESMVGAIKAFVSAYNEIRAFADQQKTAANSPLAGNAVLRTTVSSFKDVILNQVTDPSTTLYDRLALIGVSHSRTGVLEVDETRLKEALTTNLNDVRALAADVGARMVASTERVTRAGDGTVAGQVGSLERSITSLNRRASDVEARLELRRESLIRQFTAMEEALSRIQAQGNWLTGQIKTLQPANS